MESKNAAERAKEVINSLSYITLATSGRRGKPWNTPLYAVHSSDFVFYWASSPDSIHSTNIKENDEVAIVIYDSKAAAGTGLGVYMKAKAKMVTDEKELESAFSLFKPNKFITSVDDIRGDSPLRLYKAIPERAWINNVDKVKGRYVDRRDEISL